MNDLQQTPGDDLGDFLSDFMSAPMPTKAREPARQGRPEASDRPVIAGKPYRPPAIPSVAPDAQFDALVLFEQRTTCVRCGAHSRHTSFVALRRPATGGYAYVAFSGALDGLSARLPRWVQTETIEQPYCMDCFGGTPEPDPDLSRPGRAFFHPARHGHSVDNVTLLAARLGRLDFTPKATGEQTQTPPDERSCTVRADAVRCDPCPPHPPIPSGPATVEPSTVPPSDVGQISPSQSST